MVATAPIWTVGRRKTSVARLRVTPGGGKMAINGRSIEEFFSGMERHKSQVMKPLRLAKGLGSYDILVTVKGGGVTGQSEAIRLGIARAITEIDPKMRALLRKHGLLTRDPRMVERKKPGQPKARRRFQHSKR